VPAIAICHHWPDGSRAVTANRWFAERIVIRAYAGPGPLYTGRPSTEMITRQASRVGVGVLVPGGRVGMIAVGVGGTAVKVGGIVGGVMLGSGVGVGGGSTIPMREQSPSELT